MELVYDPSGLGRLIVKGSFWGGISVFPVLWMVWGLEP